MAVTLVTAVGAEGARGTGFSAFFAPPTARTAALSVDVVTFAAVLTGAAAETPGRGKKREVMMMAMTQSNSNDVGMSVFAPSSIGALRTWFHAEEPRESGLALALSAQVGASSVSGGARRTRLPAPGAVGLLGARPVTPRSGESPRAGATPVVSVATGALFAVALSLAVASPSAHRARRFAAHA